MTSYTRSFFTLTSHQKPTVGDTKTSTIQDDHMGWLLCDGREIDINTFYFLYQVIGNAYGTPVESGKFKLPNASGRVPGFVGYSGTSGGNTWALGDVSGQENHTLTIAEMPSHNHGTDSSNTVVGNGLTDLSATRITIDASGVHTHTATDSGHTHGYFNQPNTHDVAVSLTTTDTADNINVGQTTGTGYANITVASSGLHAHSITDPQHQHAIKTQGGDQKHNNMQPTIFVGNMFIYTGKPTYGKYPLPMPQTSPYPIL